MTLEEMRANVFLRKPRFGEIVRTWGEQTLLNYYSQGFENLHLPSEDILFAIENETSAILGYDLGTKTRERITADKWVNTADHHGVLHHPYFYTSALALSHERVRKSNAVTVVLPFGGVSLGNDSFPRGFSFHDTKGELHKVYLKSLAERRMPVYALNPISKETFQSEKERLHRLSLPKHAEGKIHAFFEALLAEECVWNQDTYSAQLTAMNAVLWRQLFGDERGDFVYLELESVAQRLILEKHLLHETEIFNLLFKKEWNDAFVELFSGIVGSHTSSSGTHFFWYIDHKTQARQRLTVHSGALCTDDGSIVVALTHDALTEGLRARTLMPSTALTLIVVCGVEKLVCAGGPSQLEYLPCILKAWTKLCTRFGYTTALPETSIWCGDATLFCASSLRADAPYRATLIDVLMYGDTISEQVDKALMATPLTATVDAMIPLLYALYTRTEEVKPLSFTIPSIESKQL
jgi:hypothetical protein